MKPTYHDLRAHRKKSCLTQKDIADLLGSKDVSQICRHEVNPVTPQMEICLLYHLLFNVPICSFFPVQKEAMRKRLMIRIPNLIDEMRFMPKDLAIEEKMAFYSTILTNLTQPSI